MSTGHADKYNKELELNEIKQDETYPASKGSFFSLSLLRSPIFFLFNTSEWPVQRLRVVPRLAPTTCIYFEF